MTIQSAADSLLYKLETRERKPAKPAALATFRSYVCGHIAPDIGVLDIEHFGNAQLPPAVSRYRVSHQHGAACPEDIIRYWIGHADASMTDRYSKLADDGAVRREWADRVGTGFEMPKCQL
jgi:hypothetical protein